MRNSWKPWVPRFLAVVAFAVLLGVAPTLPVPASAAIPSGAPAVLKWGHVDFVSGPSAVFGVPGRNTAEWIVEKWNREGGIRGVKIELVKVDEAGGNDKQVTEFRRLALDEKVHAVLGYTSAGTCLAIRAVVEELKVLTVAHNCSTRRLTEDYQLTYMFRTANHQAADSIMAARYILSLKPDVKTIAGANEDFSWGRDSWDDFKAAMQRLKPDVKVVTELWTKIQAGEYSAEISKLLTVQPDVIHSSFWAAGLITFVKQGVPRGLFKDRLVFLSPGEHVLQDLKRDLPDGVIVAPRATPGYFLYPDPAKNPMHKEFVDAMKARFGQYPVYPAYRTYNAFAGLRTAIEKAIDQGGGRWPQTEDIIRVFVGLTWEGPLGKVTMRSDHQAVHGGIIGLTKFNPQYGFPTIDRIMEFRAEEIIAPVGIKSPDWITTLKR